MKSKYFKILLAFGIILLATLVFNTKPTQAAMAIVKEGELTEEILEEILPSSINLDIKESELGKAEDMVYDKIKEDLATKNIILQSSMSAPELQVWFSYIDDELNVHEITVKWGETYEKKISITYSNTSLYNEADKAVIDKLFPEKFTSLPTIIVDLGKEYDQDQIADSIKLLNQMVNDPTISFAFNGEGLGGGQFFGTGGSSGFNVFKNDVYYKSILAGLFYQCELIVPNDVEDTEEAYIEYALPKVKSYLAGQEVDNSDTATMKKVNGYYYEVTVDGEPLHEYLIVKKAEGAPITDEVFVNNLPVEQIIKEEKIVKEQETKMIEEIKKQTGGKNVTILGSFELKVVLASDGLTETKLKAPIELTFDIGEQYNNKFVYILHEKHNGEYERFKNIKVVNGKVKITLSELSPIVIALQDGEISDEVPTPVKDDSPKMGVEYVAITCASLLAVISLAGIVTIKKISK